MDMLLTDTDLKGDVAAKLAQFNIRFVAQLISLAQSRQAADGIARVLDLSPDEFTNLIQRLKRQTPEEDTLPFFPTHSMGYRVSEEIEEKLRHR